MSVFSKQDLQVRKSKRPSLFGVKLNMIFYMVVGLFATRQGLSTMHATIITAEDVSPHQAKRVFLGTQILIR